MSILGIIIACLYCLSFSFEMEVFQKNNLRIELGGEAMIKAIFMLIEVAQIGFTAGDRGRWHPIWKAQPTSKL